MGGKNKKQEETENSNEFFEFIKKQCITKKYDKHYEYSIGRTILRRMNLKDIFCNAQERLRRSYERFSRKDQTKTNKKNEKIIIRKKVGSCWDLAMAMDYRLMLKGEKNHHIVAIPMLRGCVPHMFNLLVRKDGLMFIDVLKKYDGWEYNEINSCVRLGTFCDCIYGLGSDWANYKNWYVMDQVTGDKNEGRLAYKKWAKFCGTTEEDGGFMVIDSKNGVFKLNPKVKYNISSFKRLFLLWG